MEAGNGRDSRVVAPSLREFLTGTDHDEPLTAPEHLWGFGGLHGGLVLATLVGAAQELSPQRRLRSVSGRFHRPVRGNYVITTSALRDRGVVVSYFTQALSGGDVLADATAVFGRGRSQKFPTRTLPMPSLPPWQDLEVFEVPIDFVPVTAQVEIRLIGPNMPYRGHEEAELRAWMRLVGDEGAPDEQTLLVLLDALAPSYSAVLNDLTAMPTLELNAHFTAHLEADASPWVLLIARTDHAPGDGWVSEQFDLWSESGQHLATAHQLRVITR